MTPLRLVHMGDSITEGQHINPALRWTTLIEQRVVAAFGNGAVESFNRAVSGETTRMGLERYPPDVQELLPDVLTLQYGMNDCNCWDTDRGLPRVSEAAFSANVTEMIVRARRFGAKRIVLATNPRTLRERTMPSGIHYEEANARYSELLRRVAAKTRVTLCDIRAQFDSLTDEETVPLLLPAPDLLHLSERGHEYYAETMWPSIESAVAELLGRRTEAVAS